MLLPERAMFETLPVSTSLYPLHCSADVVELSVLTGLGWQDAGKEPAFLNAPASMALAKDWSHQTDRQSPGGRGQRLEPAARPLRSRAPPGGTPG
jgi:hypothetical protein